MPKAKKKNPAHYTLRWIAMHAPSFVRRDPGGTKVSARREALSSAHIPVTPDTEAAYALGAKKARDTINEYLKPVWSELKRVVG